MQVLRQKLPHLQVTRGSCQQISPWLERALQPHDKSEEGEGKRESGPVIGQGQVYKIIWKRKSQ